MSDTPINDDTPPELASLVHCLASYPGIKDVTPHHFENGAWSMAFSPDRASPDCWATLTLLAAVCVYRRRVGQNIAMFARSALPGATDPGSHLYFAIDGDENADPDELAYQIDQCREMAVPHLVRGRDA